MIHDGELRQLDLVHPRHSIVSSSPVELDVICSVTIWHREQELLRIVNSHVHNQVPSGSPAVHFIHHLIVFP